MQKWGALEDTGGWRPFVRGWSDLGSHLWLYKTLCEKNILIMSVKKQTLKLRHRLLQKRFFCIFFLDANTLIMLINVKTF